jgi:hypothetical protein
VKQQSNSVHLECSIKILAHCSQRAGIHDDRARQRAKALEGLFSGHTQTQQNRHLLVGNINGRAQERERVVVAVHVLAKYVNFLNAQRKLNGRLAARGVLIQSMIVLRNVWKKQTRLHSKTSSEQLVAQQIVAYKDISVDVCNTRLMLELMRAFCNSI